KSPLPRKGSTCRATQQVLQLHDVLGRSCSHSRPAVAAPDVTIRRVHIDYERLPNYLTTIAEQLRPCLGVLVANGSRNERPKRLCGHLQPNARGSYSPEKRRTNAATSNLEHIS